MSLWFSVMKLPVLKITPSLSLDIEMDRETHVMSNFSHLSCASCMLMPPLTSLRGKRLPFFCFKGVLHLITMPFEAGGTVIYFPPDCHQCSSRWWGFRHHIRRLWVTSPQEIRINFQVGRAETIMILFVCPWNYLLIMYSNW